MHDIETPHKCLG